MPTRKQLEEALANGDFDPDDDDEEYEVGFADGSYVKGKHSRIAKIAAARGFKLEADPEPAGDDKPAKGDKVVRPAHFGGGSSRRSS